MAECDKFFRQVGNDPFGAAVKTRRNALYEWSHLCNFHDHIYFPPALHNAGSATKFHFRPIGSLTRSSTELITEILKSLRSPWGVGGGGNRSIWISRDAKSRLDYFADLSGLVSSILTTPSATLDVEIDACRRSCLCSAS